MYRVHLLVTTMILWYLHKLMTSAVCICCIYAVPTGCSFMFLHLFTFKCHIWLGVYAAYLCGLLG